MTAYRNTDDTHDAIPQMVDATSYLNTAQEDAEAEALDQFMVAFDRASARPSVENFRRAVREYDRLIEIAGRRVGE